MPNAIDMIRQDHEKVKGLFQQFESAADQSEKQRIVDSTLVDLEVHSKLEEQFFYPFVREVSNQDALMDEELEEHHVARMLVMELAQIEPNNSRYDAKFKVLSESVKQHIQEEEEKVLPMAERADPGQLDDLGRRMSEKRPDFEKESKEMVEGSIKAKAKSAFQQLQQAMGR